MTEVGSRVGGVEIDFGPDRLVPVIVQDESSRDVLMLAYTNREALALTLESGRAHYYSRSRGELWRKGDSSGNVQHVSRVAVDCDGDALIYFVQQVGVACHTGEWSCFHRGEEVAEGRDRSQRPGVTSASYDSASGEIASDAERSLVLGRALALLESVVEERLKHLPQGSYVTTLHERGLGYVSQKVVEEAGETIVAALERREDGLIEESADLLFHLAVLLHECGQSLTTVAALLESRHHDRSRGTPPT